MTDTAVFAAVLAAIAGFLAGRAFSAEAARDRDKQGPGSSEHFVQGLELLSEGRREKAVAEFQQVPRDEPGGEVVALVLGNLLRETGQLERALQVHQQLASRTGLTSSARARVLAALGEDHRRAGLLDRATRMFEQALEADAEHVPALVGLQKINEDQRRWEDAFAIRVRISRSRRVDDSLVLAHLQAEIGKQRLRLRDPVGAEEAFRAALAHDRRVLPAQLGLSEVLLGRDPALAFATLEDAAKVSPERAYLLFERLEKAAAAADDPQRYTTLLETLIQRSPRDWRARLALARALRSRGDALEALGLLRRAVDENPHALLAHLETWRTLLALGLPRGEVESYLSAVEDSLLYASPHVCTSCRYRAAEVQWRCPQCHEWDTFVEERISSNR